MVEKEVIPKLGGQVVGRQIYFRTGPGRTGLRVMDLVALFTDEDGTTRYVGYEAKSGVTGRSGAQMEKDVLITTNKLPAFGKAARASGLDGKTLDEIIEIHP
jgi:hypothetical protein